MQQVGFANGKLWGALDTALTVDGVDQGRHRVLRRQPGPAAGASLPSRVSGTRRQQPDVPGDRRHAERPRRHGLHRVGATTTRAPATPGSTPRSAPATSTSHRGSRPRGRIHELQVLRRDPPRTRWGDYGAAALDGNAVWIASSPSTRPARSPSTLGAGRELWWHAHHARELGHHGSARSRRSSPPLIEKRKRPPAGGLFRLSVGYGSNSRAGGCAASLGSLRADRGEPVAAAPVRAWVPNVTRTTPGPRRDARLGPRAVQSHPHAFERVVVRPADRERRERPHLERRRNRGLPTCLPRRAPASM